MVPLTPLREVSASVAAASSSLLGPAGFHGRPLVVLCAEDWTRPSGVELRRLRSELRGLGAALVLVVTDQVLCLEPDAETDVAEPSCDRAAFEALFRSPRQRPVTSSELRLAILGTGGDVVWLHTVEPGPSPAAALIDALSGARRRLQQSVGRTFAVTRRELITSLIGAFAMTFGDACRPSAPASTPLPPSSAPPASGERKVALTVNGERHELSIEPRVSLLDALRERIGLTGTKKGCDHGQCGACTVLLGGRRVNSCLLLAVMVREPVTTIEGLGSAESLHPLQEAFIAEDGLQCGYCTPGQIMSAAGLLAEGRAHDPAQIREQMSGNICRCGAYPNIVRAISRASRAAP
jgi:xanthine dehydrogenase YagT iron-sulfur-binding subunit